MITVKHFDTAHEMYNDMREVTSKGGDYCIHNYVCSIKAENFTPAKTLIETDLWPKDAIHFYAIKNIGLEYSQNDFDKYVTEYRGGEQGNYKVGMQRKINNVIDCLENEPKSKRAVITIPYSEQFSSEADWRNRGQTKCVRELHFYIEDNRLFLTAILRVQNSDIMPKNIYMFALLTEMVSQRLNVSVGGFTQFTTSLLHDRTATCC